jgi:hypothetical protein
MRMSALMPAQIALSTANWLQQEPLLELRIRLSLNHCTSSCIVAPGDVNPGHMMLAPDNTNLIAPCMVR